MIQFIQHSKIHHAVFVEIPGQQRRRATPHRRRAAVLEFTMPVARQYRYRVRRKARHREIREAISYGVVKMNVDTDTQYAFTRPVAGHMFANYDGVLKVDGEVGNKKAYDPRTWGKSAEANMAARVVQACEDLMSAGKRLG